LGGQGPAGMYVSSLAAAHREKLRERLRREVLKGAADGPFLLRARAWAVRGKRPSDG
jgi:hypothetical protein